MMTKTCFILLLAAAFGMALASAASAQTCPEDNPVRAIVTKGREVPPGPPEGSPPDKKNNIKVIHQIVGNIIGDAPITVTEWEIPVCLGTGVVAVVTDSTGTPTNISLGSLVCTDTGCSGFVNTVERYRSHSADFTDVDTIKFIPQ